MNAMTAIEVRIGDKLITEAGEHTVFTKDHNGPMVILYTGNRQDGFTPNVYSPGDLVAISRG